MKKFQFRLQRLFEIRQEKEDQQKAILAKASGEYQRALNEKNDILHHVDEARNNILSSQDDSGNLSLSQLRNFDKMLQDSEYVIDELEIKIDKKRQKMEKELQKYTKLKQDRMAVEKLKDKAYEQYQYETQREEIRTNDEIGKNIFLNHKD